MAKADLKDAYRQVPLAPDQYWLVGFKLMSSYYHDTRLPMGARSSCAIFERVASALVYILQSVYKVRYVVKMLDDFLFIGASKEECEHGLVSFEHLCNRLNLPLASDKTVRASKQLVFLGIHLDSERQLASIPPEKALKYMREAESLANRSSCSLRELREISGKLEHATCIIKGGRAFIRRLHEAKQGFQSPSRRIKLLAPLKEDLLFWAHFLRTYNSETLFAFILELKPCGLSIGSDASKVGFGGYCGKSCIAGIFPASWRSLDIEALELYPILVLVGAFAAQLRDSQVRVRCDNLPLVHCLNKLSSKNSTVMALMRPLVLYLLHHNISIKAEYISTKDNWFCDTLSRRQVSKQWLEKQGMHQSLVPIPAALQPRALRIDSTK